ncbi:MAG: hypothetical protein J7M26_10535, partial [Armatimonadetes bacterium]|nr:hypothetical protein [Armatimonadota bacterium]
MIALALVMLAAGCSQPSAPGWQGDCKFVEQRQEWRRLDMTLRPGKLKAVRLYLRIQQATGTVWFDDVQIEGLEVKNPSFEAVERHRIAHWGQDDIGKTIFSEAAFAHRGKRCLKIHRDTPGMSRVWQDLAVQPGKTYKVHVWARWEGVKGLGHAYGEIYGIKSDGNLDGILTSTPRLSGTSRTVVTRWWQMDLAATGRARASWPLKPAELGTYQVDTSVDLSALKGQAAIELRQGGKAAAVVTLKPSKEEQPVRLVAKLAGPTELRVTVTGEGTVKLKPVILGRLQILPLPQRVKWLPPAQNFPLTSKTVIVVPDGAQGRHLTGARWLAREVARVAGITPPIVQASKYTGGPALLLGTKQARQKLTALGLTVPQHDEGYVLAVRPQFVAVAGHDDRGTFYGTVTLLWLLQRLGDRPEIVAADITDWPDLPFRGTYGLYGSPQAAAETFARLKLNAVLIESGDYYHLDDAKTRAKTQAVFAKLREYWLDPIPELQSFGHGGAVLSVVPMAVEGQWVQGEKYVLKGTAPVELKHRNVLVTKATRPQVTSADGKVVYQEGRDYELLAGETKLPYTEKNKPWRIVRKAAGRIKDGETVLVSYDYAPRGAGSYCPNEPAVYEVMGRAIRNTIRYLHPRWLHVGHDEITRMNRDSRCKKAGRTNAENLAMELKRLLAFARQEDPDIKIMLWADMLNPYHNGRGYYHNGPCMAATDLLPPKDFIMNVWFYGAGQPPTRGLDSIKFFAERGIATTGSPWYNADCARQWAQVCAQAKRDGLPSMGVLYTSWSQRWD